MSWLTLTTEQRKAAVAEIDALIQEECPDRFWYSAEQDGERTQEMFILLPAAEDQYYSIHVQTAQLKALRELAASFDYSHDSECLPQELLDRVAIVGEEHFELDDQHAQGILYEVVMDVPGLTHVVIDSLLDDFLHRGGIPPQPKKINPINLVKRLLEAESEGYLKDSYPLS